MPFITSFLGLDSTGDSSEQTSTNLQMLDDASDLVLLQNSFSGHEDFSMSIPPDQVQMIQNINSLVTEVVGHF